MVLPGNSSLPLRDQVCEVISEAISNNSIDVTKALPSCRQLSEHLKISRNTVLSAYARLIDLNIVTSRDRRGYYVNPDFVVGHAIRSTEHTRLAPEISHNLLVAGNLPSKLRKIDHPANWSQFPYPFVYNQIDPRLFPVQGWRESMRLALNMSRMPVWTGDSDGFDSSNLVDQLRKRLLGYRGLRAEPDEILITAGAQNALFILGLLFGGQGASVAVENPGYPEARNAFVLTGSHVHGVDVDALGLLVDEIPSECGLVYLTPSHQFPTTVTMPLARRAKLVDLARQRGLLVVEDDYDAEMNYLAAALPPIKAFDDTGLVVYVGSLSKTLSPGLRLGFMVAHPTIIKEARALRRAMLRHPPTLLQDAMANFLKLGHQDAHMSRLHRRYKRRWEEMGKAISQFLPDLPLGASQGGTSFWINGPPELDTDRLEENLRRRGVLIDKGGVFYIREAQGRGKFRLGFGSIPFKAISPGIELIGEEIRRLL